MVIQRNTNTNGRSEGPVQPSWMEPWAGMQGHAIVGPNPAPGLCFNLPSRQFFLHAQTHSQHPRLQLVQRGARGSTLTDVGRRYHAQIVGDLLRLQNHTLEAMAQRPDVARPLVGCVPVFAERWLLPRLPAFLAAHKGCSLHLQVYPTLI